MQITNANLTTDWEKLNDNMPKFNEGEVYEAVVDEVRLEPSRLHPGTNFPRVFFTVYDKSGRTQKMSWIGTGSAEQTKEMLCRLDPQAMTKPFSGLCGLRCSVVVTLRRGVCVTQIVALVGNEVGA